MVRNLKRLVFNYDNICIEEKKKAFFWGDFIDQ